MSNDEKTLVDKIWNSIRNNKIAASIIIMGIIIISAATFKKSFCELFPSLPIVCKTETPPPPPPPPKICQVEKDFKVSINFRDSQIDKKNSIKEALDTIGYYKISHSENFSGLQTPGKEGTAWLVYPQCIKETDEKIQKVIKILNNNGYKTDETLKVFPHSKQDWQGPVQIDLF